jgi:hypothetical protein
VELNRVLDRWNEHLDGREKLLKEWVARNTMHRGTLWLEADCYEQIWRFAHEFLRELAIFAYITFQY